MVKIQFSIEDISERDAHTQKKSPLPEVSNTFFLLTFSVAKRVSSLSKKLFLKK